MAEKIGVYVCECGPNIVEKMDVGEVVKFASNLGDVVVAESHRLLCSEEGKEMLKTQIKEHALSRIVIAACSPKEHQITFMKVCQEAELNPYLIQIANIREQCAWVTADKLQATEKAKALVKAAVRRVGLHQALERKEIDCVADVLVLGAGVAGIEASLLLAQEGRKVYLVEKSPSIGGKTARFEEVFPAMECAPCMLEPKLDEVLHKENIELLTYSEIEEVLGFYGNFTVKIKKKARYVDPIKCLGCGACFERCPVEVKNEFNEGLDKRKAIYIPYAGALPNVAVVDRENCLHFKGKECTICKEDCPFEAIDFHQEDVISEVKVGAVVLATGFDIFDCKKAPQFGYGKFDNVYTSLEFERLLSSTGPTEGKILLKNGEPPKSVAIIHCVGSRNKSYNQYCSGVCCMYSLKFAHLIRKKLPDTNVFEFHSDFCLPGKGYQELYEQVLEQDVSFIRVKDSNTSEVIQKDGKLVVRSKDCSGKTSETSVDMVVLAPAIESSIDTPKIAELFSISQGKDGFFVEEHGKLAPVSTTTEGIFIVGCAQGPKDIQNSVAQGGAAAGKVLSSLIPGKKLELETMITEIDEELCSGCKICISLCPYKAITFDEEKKIAVVNDVLCKGCGTCTAACPSGATKSRHFTLDQIFAEIEEVVR